MDREKTHCKFPTRNHFVTVRFKQRQANVFPVPLLYRETGFRKEMGKTFFRTLPVRFFPFVGLGNDSSL